MSTHTPKASGKPRAKPKPPAVPRQPPEDHGPILELIRDLVPDHRRWMMLPHVCLYGFTPYQVVGSDYEPLLRDLLLRAKYGVFG